ncbi:MAG TPA: hypothetical protein PKN37_08785, partial [Mesotoga sp.]|nr:hypothetical protein [Mesotoga sp.]
FLSETPNPGQDSWRDRYDVINDPDYPLSHRAGLQLQIIRSLFGAYEMMIGETIEVENLPSYEEVMQNGIFSYLN